MKKTYRYNFQKFVKRIDLRYRCLNLGKSKINSISVRNIDDIPNRLLDGFISKMGAKEDEGASQRKNRRVVVFHADRL